jgi:fibronectin type 3 domain-containing protein
MLLWCGCGYVGEPLPPLLNIPQPVMELAAVQRGATIIVQFVLPKLTTEKRVLRQPLEWDLRIGEPGKGEFRTEEWAERTKSPAGGRLENGLVRYEIPAAPWVGKDVVVAVRVASPNGRKSDWSRLVVLSVVQPPAAPHDLKPENVAEGVRLTWSGSGPAYRVFRRTEADSGFVVAANTESPEYLDRSTEYGKPVLYVVQAIVKTGTSEVESELSEQKVITPVDVFPPAVPAGLAAVPTVGSIELAWDRDTEPDLAGYRIYRAGPEGEFVKIGETAETPSYSDKQVESGKQYRYAVSAFDKSGNESKQSVPIEVAAP